MTISKISNNISFKGVYYVNPPEQDGRLHAIDKRSFNNANTEKLHKLLNPNYTKLCPYANKDILLIQCGELAGCVNVSKPALILTNDEHDMDALCFLNEANGDDAELQELNEKPLGELEEMLTESEIKIAKAATKNPPITESIRFPIKNYKDRAVEILEKKLNARFAEKEKNWYEYFIKKAKVLEAVDLKALHTEIANSFQRIVKNIPMELISKF